MWNKLNSKEQVNYINNVFKKHSIMEVITKIFTAILSIYYLQVLVFAMDTLVQNSAEMLAQNKLSSITEYTHFYVLFGSQILIVVIFTILMKDIVMKKDIGKTEILHILENSFNWFIRLSLYIIPLFSLLIIGNTVTFIILITLFLIDGILQVIIRLIGKRLYVLNFNFKKEEEVMGNAVCTKISRS